MCAKCQISTLHAVALKSPSESMAQLLYHSLQTLVRCFTFHSVKLIRDFRVQGSAGAGNQTK